MQTRTAVQAVGLLGLALGLSTQLSGVTTSNQTHHPALADGKAPSLVVARRNGPRSFSPNATIRVNGRTNPEQVPDELAFRVYLKSMTLRGTPTEQQLQRRHAFLKELGLSSDDEKRFLQIVNGIAPELTDVERQRKELTNADASALSKQMSLKDREDRALDMALMKLTGELSSEAWSKVNGHVHGHVKKAIVVFEVNHGAAGHGAH